MATSHDVFRTDTGKPPKSVFKSSSSERSFDSLVPGSSGGVRHDSRGQTHGFVLYHPKAGTSSSSSSDSSGSSSKPSSTPKISPVTSSVSSTSSTTKKGSVASSPVRQVPLSTTTPNRRRPTVPVVSTSRQATPVPSKSLGSSFVSPVGGQAAASGVNAVGNILNTQQAGAEQRHTNREWMQMADRNNFWDYYYRYKLAKANVGLGKQVMSNQNAAYKEKLRLDYNHQVNTAHLEHYYHSKVLAESTFNQMGLENVRSKYQTDLLKQEHQNDLNLIEARRGDFEKRYHFLESKFKEVGASPLAQFSQPSPMTQVLPTGSRAKVNTIGGVVGPSYRSPIQFEASRGFVDYLS